MFVDKTPPPEVKKALRRAGARVFGPGGSLEQDDMDTWQGCTPNEQGVDHRCYAYSCEMDLGHERFHGISGHWPATTAAAKATIVTSISAGLA